MGAEMTSKRERKAQPRQAYLQWLRYQRALRESTLPVDVYLRGERQPMGFQAYAEHYALQQWLRSGNKPPRKHMTGGYNE